VSERLLTTDVEGLGNSRETLISIFIIWVEILAQSLQNVGQASYPFEATFDKLKLPCRYYSARARAMIMNGTVRNSCDYIVVG